MSNYSSLKATINANVKTNGNQEITGQVMNAVLNAMVNSLGSGYQYMGIATPTNPGTNQTPDDRCFYIATTPGTYSHLGGLVVNDGEVAILKYDSAWSKEVTGAATAEQLTQLGQEVEQQLHSSFIEYRGWMTDNNGTYGNVATNAFIVIPVREGMTYNITKSATHNAHTAFLNSFTGIPSTAFDINGGRILLDASTPTATGIVPTGAKFIYILRKYSNNYWALPSVKLDGVDITLPLEQEVLQGAEETKNVASSIGAIQSEVTTKIALTDFDYYDKGVVATPDSLTIDGWLRWDGLPQSSTTSFVSDFIPVLPNVRYIGYTLPISGGTSCSLCQYDANKTFISGTAIQPVNNVGGMDFTTNASARYVRIAARTAYKPYVFLREATTLTSLMQFDTPRLFPKANLPVIAFCFDDGNPNDASVATLFKSRNAKCSFALMYERVDRFLPYLGYQHDGMSIVGHAGDIFDTGHGWTPETAGARFELIKTTLEGAGFTINGFIAPNSVMDSSFVPECEKVFAYCFAGSSANTRQTNPCTLARYSMQSNTVANTKAYIDDCIANDKICVLYGHTENFGTTYSGEVWDINKVDTLLQYAITKRDARLAYLDNLDNCVKYFFGL